MEIAKRGKRMRWPQCATDEKSVERVATLPTLDDIVLDQHSEFLDFIKKLLTIDPDERSSSAEALTHPFITN